MYWKSLIRLKDICSLKIKVFLSEISIGEPYRSNGYLALSDAHTHKTHTVSFIINNFLKELQKLVVNSVLKGTSGHTTRGL